MSEAVVPAWWLAARDVLPNGDGRKIVIGETHTVPGPPVLCKHGLHGSRHPFAALRHAPGPILYRVECSGWIMEEEDKLCSTARRYLAMRGITEPLWRFARGEALRVAHLWGAPAEATEYLRTGNEEAMDAAYRAAAAVPMSEIGWPRYWAAQATKAAANRRHSPGSLVKALAILASLTGEESIFRGAAERFLTLVNAEFARDPVVGAPALAHD